MDRIINLPEGYKAVSYLEADGNQYIDSGYAFTEPELKVEFKYLKTDLNTNVFGVDTGGGGVSRFMHGHIYGNNFYVGSFGRALDTELRQKVNTVYEGGVVITGTTAEDQQAVLTINGKSQTFAGTASCFFPGTTIKDALFATVNAGGTYQYKLKGRIYYIRFYDNTGTLVRNFEPCVRTLDNKPGMYDTVHDVFYTNQGDGEDFTAGPEVFLVRFLNFAGDDLLGTVLAEYGEDITSKAPAPEEFTGKVFNGWTQPITYITASITVKATYADRTFTVRFLNYAGDDLLGTAVVAYGGDATSQAPTPEVIEGKTFTGWNADITHVLSDMTVRPTYGDIVYTVVFTKYGGGNASVQHIVHGHSATAPTPLLVEGHHFVGWDEDFSHVVSDLTVNPIYEPNVYTVRFLDKDKTTVVSEQEVEHGKGAVPPVPQKYTRYIFIEWSSSFSYITEDTTIWPVYRDLPTNPRLSVYAANEDGSSGELKQIYRGVNDCSVVQKLDGECSLAASIVTRQTEGIIQTGDRVEVEGLVFAVNEIKKNISSGICYTEFSGDHVSYLLNSEDYKVQAFDMTDTPKNILRILLSGTPFTVGDVDPTEEVTLRVNKSVTRRACVMQLVALTGGEIEYYGYSIGIRSHVGTSAPVEIMSESLVQDISFSCNAAEDVTNYSLSLYQKGSLEIGDELHILFPKLGINAYSRIVGIDWNPFNYKEVSITVGQYIPTINDSLYQLETTVEDIRQSSAKYTVEFGELIGTGTMYFTRAYRDRPYFHIHTDDGSEGTVTLLRRGGSEFDAYIGATLSGVTAATVTLMVFYCTVPVDEEETE